MDNSLFIRILAHLFKEQYFYAYKYGMLITVYDEFVEWLLHSLVSRD